MPAPLSRVLRPVLLLSGLAGVLPRGFTSSFQLLLGLHSLCLLALLAAACMASLLTLQSTDFLLYDSFMHLALEKTQRAFLFLNFAAVLLSALLHQTAFLEVVRKLSGLDKALADMQLHFAYRRRDLALTFSVRFLLLLALAGLDYFLSTDIGYWLYILTDLLSTHGPLIPIFAYEIQFYATLTFIADHLTFITEEMKSIMNEQPMNTALKKVYKLIRFNEDLKEMASELNRISSFSNLITVASIFFLGVVNFHLVGIAGHFKRMWLYSFLIGGVFLRLYELWNIIQPFVQISDKVEEFNSALFKWILFDKTEVLKKQDKLLTHFSVKRDISFFAMGMFPLDQSVIHSIIASATTLLVILIQYSLSKTQLWCD